jgi:hypothetical protein
MTIQETLNLHKELWNRIKNKCHNAINNDSCYYEDEEAIKTEYLEEMGYGVYELAYNCFCCEYTIDRYFIEIILFFLITLALRPRMYMDTFMDIFILTKSIEILLLILFVSARRD